MGGGPDLVHFTAPAPRHSPHCRRAQAQKASRMAGFPVREELCVLGTVRLELATDLPTAASDGLAITLSEVRSRVRTFRRDMNPPNEPAADPRRPHRNRAADALDATPHPNGPHFLGGFEAPSS